MHQTEDTQWLLNAVEALAQTAVSGGEYWRATYTDQDRKAVALLKEYMEQGGMETGFDAVGNLFGTVPGASGEVIMAGSHRDTVRHGGKYDGILGVLTALAAVRSLYAELGRPRKTVRVAALCEEESSRFPVSYLGSRYLCGELRGEELDKCDRQGVVLRDAMRSAGYLKVPFGSDARKPGRFVELHIEQGGVLEHERTQIGIVQSIVGWYEGEMIFRGRQNHAGTTPMALRLDPMPVACDFVCRLHRWAATHSGDMVCTVGRIEAQPGNTNVIPGSVRVSLDIRSADRARLDEARLVLERLRAELSGGVEITLATQCDEPPAPLDREGAGLLTQIAGELGLSHRPMVSGAGHDSQVMARHVPTNMIFIPSAGGISHSTDESSSPGDIAAGYALLREYLRRMAW